MSRPAAGERQTFPVQTKRMWKVTKGCSRGGVGRLSFGSQANPSPRRTIAAGGRRPASFHVRHQGADVVVAGNRAARQHPVGAESTAEGVAQPQCLMDEPLRVVKSLRLRGSTWPVVGARIQEVDVDLRQPLSPVWCSLDRGPAAGTRPRNSKDELGAIRRTPEGSRHSRPPW